MSTCLAATALAAQPAPPVLQLSGNDFPELVVISRETDANGESGMLSCDRIRSKRIDELDPLWKQAVERIHLDCEDLGEHEDGANMAATVVTGFLKPGQVQFAGVPVAEVRLMDSELWGDHQYLLDRPFTEIRDAIKTFVESRCRAQSESSGALVTSDCNLLETPEGVYLQTSEVGGIWMHPSQDEPQRTVYAEAWAD
ncbi:hypothetical protein DT603_09785 [Pseudoxanthomonas gei]|uniref:Uncharacterized protein n=1 Tax=Pseudoxanthomonas gei TaxID=1383030 RepID=A0ABX0AF64_9GAMM|nr:hypothetical protein [Pseudoxanthomonas gei]NDK39130.1 hypothetical protein [Pseudoxanthomonas gei]